MTPLTKEVKWLTSPGYRAHPCISAEWQLQAPCRGMDVSMFYDPPNERNQAREDRIAAAKKICHECPAISASGKHALEIREPYGIWGGLSQEEWANI